MKQKIVIATAMFATLFMLVPAMDVKAAEMEPVELSIEAVSAQDSIATYADVIETKYRIYKNKPQYRRWNATRGYWVDKDWIDL